MTSEFCFNNVELNYKPQETEIDVQIDQIRRNVAALSKSQRTEKILQLIGCIDLTTLSGDDTPDIVYKLVDRALKPLPEEISNIAGLNANQTCAAVCVYPARILDVVDRMNKSHLSNGKRLKIASVAGGFPSGQYKLESRLLEIKLAIEDGATEIDTVINRCAALMNNWQEVYDELMAMKALCGATVCLKTILATGELKSLENVHKASMTAMIAGSDFIKTSTGKETVNATLPVCFVMCQAIKQYYSETGRKVGFKPAGGIKTANEALAYLMAVESLLGKDWINPNLFRIGASSLLDDLVKNLMNN